MGQTWWSKAMCWRLFGWWSLYEKMEIHGRIGSQCLNMGINAESKWMLFCAKWCVIACWPAWPICPHFLGLHIWSFALEVSLACGWMSPIFSAGPVFRVWAITGTTASCHHHQGLCCPHPSPRPLCWPVPLIPTCWPAADLANASSLIKDTHMCNCQSHPCTLVRVQSHQVLCQLIDQAIYLPFKDACWEYFIFWLHGQSGLALVYAFDWLMVQRQCLIFFRNPHSTSPWLLIMTSLFVLWYFETWPTDWDSQYFKLGGGVLCHHSPRWISLAFGQHPLYSVGNLISVLTALYKPCYSSLHPDTPSHPPFASSWHLLTPELSHWATSSAHCNRQSNHVWRQEAKGGCEECQDGSDE